MRLALWSNIVAPRLWKGVVFLSFISVSLATVRDTVELKCVEKLEIDPDFGEANVTLKRLKRGGPNVMSAYLKMYRDFDPNAMCEIEGSFKDTSGKYHYGAMVIPPSNCCDGMKNDKLIWPSLIEQNKKIPRNCPVKADTFIIQHYTVDPKPLPNPLPTPDGWKFVYTIFNYKNGIKKILFQATLCAKFLRNKVVT